MKKLLSLLILSGCFCTTGVLAQEQKPAEAPKEQESKEVASGSIFNTAVELNVGTQGLGLEFKTPLFSRLSLRAGGNFLFLQTQREDTFGEEKANMKMDASFQQVHAIADFQPFANAKSVMRKFILSAGAAYYFKAEGNANFQPTESYNYGQITFGPDEIGEVDAQVKWNRVAPYAGLGFTNLNLIKKLKLNAGLGMYYFQAPDVKFTGTKMVAGNNEENEATVERNMKDYRYLPALTLGFSYPLNF